MKEEKRKKERKKTRRKKERKKKENKKRGREGRKKEGKKEYYHISTAIRIQQQFPSTKFIIYMFFFNPHVLHTIFFLRSQSTKDTLSDNPCSMTQRARMLSLISILIFFTKHFYSNNLSPILFLVSIVFSPTLNHQYSLILSVHLLSHKFADLIISC